MSYSLNSLKGGYIGDYIRDDYGFIKGDTRSLDKGSYFLILTITHKDVTSVLGFRVWGLGFRALGFRVLGFRVLGFRVLAFRVLGFRV